MYSPKIATKKQIGKL